MVRFVNTFYKASLPISLAIWMVCLMLFVGHYSASKQAVYGDGIGYYAYARSWLIDGNSDTTDEYRHIYNWENNNAARPAVSDVVQIVAVSPNGRAANHFSPGPALLFFPGLLLGHILSLTSDTLGLSLSTTGYADFYQVLTGITALSWFTLGMWLAHQWLSATTKKSSASTWATVALWLGSPLIYYGGYDVVNSHFAAWLLICAWWWWYWPRRLSNEPLHSSVAGLLAGAATLIRPQDGVIVLIWGLDQLLIHFQTTQSVLFSKGNLTNLFKKIFFFVVAWFIPIAFLLYHWLITFGSLNGHLYLEEIRRPVGHSVDWLGSLWHPMTGIFTRTPYVLLMVIYGCGRLLRKKTSLVEKYLALFAVMEWLIISWQGGWFAAAFGGRMYITSLTWPALASVYFWENIRTNRQLPNYFAPLLLTGIALTTLTSMALFILQT
jgi:hypothetical protein